MKVAIADLREKVLNTLSKNFSPSESSKIADYLIWAEMSGIKTQGILKMTGTEPIQNIKAQHEIRVERDKKLAQLLNAGANPAPLVSMVATEAVIKKAKEHGFGMVGVHNYFSSNGAQAYYAEKIAQEDLIGIVLCSQPASVAPFESIDPLFGTNPIGFSFPTNGDPFILDLATSAMTWYGLVLAKTKGEKIPENMAIDRDGNLTTDPAEAMAGALLPFDRSYKSSGIGMVIEIMGGPLVSAAYCDLEGEWGALFMAIDPDLLIDIKEFKANSSDLIKKIKSSRKRAGVDEIRLPGERALAARKEAEKSGFVDIEEKVLKELGYI
ncbi:MAG TPA: Ldh family oxidoreductase [Candidatus Saccharimonadales bacterium]|nr:Ldh family oxidoreductase [Candidatus Saccharimonadales bacterium]